MKIFDFFLTATYSKIWDTLLKTYYLYLLYKFDIVYTIYNVKNQLKYKFVQDYDSS